MIFRTCWQVAIKSQEYNVKTKKSETQQGEIICLQGL